MLPYVLIFILGLCISIGWYLQHEWKNAQEDPADKYPQDIGAD